ncbi:MAG: HDOD domain-containing protein [Deltaproteobacteria bacterium]|nr:HDOD domain-containing protein [Deltaproteobacteria bacterium]
MQIDDQNTKERFSRLQRYIDRMPSLSTTVTKVLEICNHPNTSPNDLNKVISLDPVLTGQVLKLINSAYYSLPNKVTSLTRAIIILGLNTVKNLALSTAILGSLGKNTSNSLNMDHFWSHSICVGVMAKALADLKRIPAPIQEEFFIAGLLHDLGKIPLSDCFSEDYAKVLDLTNRNGCDLKEAETSIFGFDHCETGRMIAEKWKLTDSILKTLAYHHQPESVDSMFRNMILFVSIGNLYANYHKIGYAGGKEPNLLDIHFIMGLSDFKWEDVLTLEEKVRLEIDKAQIFLKVGKEEQVDAG